MVVISVGNSYSKVSGLTLAELSKLRKKMSYLSDSAEAYHAGRHRYRIHYIGKRGDFPTGLLKRIRMYLETVQIKFEVKDTRVRPKQLETPFTLDFRGVLTPKPFQVNAVERLSRHIRGGAEMVTASGKSVTMAMLIAKMNVKTLVIVPTVELKKQLSESFHAWFGSTRHIRVENIDSPVLKVFKDFDMLIVDEAHHTAARTYRDLNKYVWNDVYHRFFFTGTFFRNNSEEQMLFEGIAGQRTVKYTYRQAVADDVIVPIDAFYVEVDTQETDAFTWSEVYSELVVNNGSRNILLGNIFNKLRESNKSVLLLVKEIAHGSTLANVTHAPFANGKDDDTRISIQEFKEGKITGLIGTTGVVGEGVDTKPCEWVIVAGLGKAKSQFMQIVGRALRKYPGKESGKIILVKDKSHRFTLKHFREQCKILRIEYGVKPIKLEL